MHGRTAGLALLVAGALASPVLPEGFAFPDTQARDIAGLRVVIATPSQPAPPKGYGLVLALDAAWTFGTLRDAAGLLATRGAVTGVGPTVVAGIGYPTDTLRDMDARAHDTVGAGRAAYLAALGKVVDSIAGDFAIDPDRVLLMGHSYGGAFTLYACGQRPGLASHWVAISPSLWAVTGPTDLPCKTTKLAIDVGAEERATADMPPDRAQKMRDRDMIGRAEAMARATHARFRVLEGEDHGSILPRALTDALEFMWE